MARRMLINAQRPEEVRFAIASGDVLDVYQVAVADADLMRGNVYRGVVASINPSLNAAFVNFGAEKQGFLSADDVVVEARHRQPPEGNRHPRIEQILDKGKPIIVQVSREGIDHKGAALTSKLSLAGRYLVLMPYDDSRGISRKVEDETARKEMRELADKIAVPEGFGVILRTSALGQNKTALNRDLNAVMRIWKRIVTEADRGKKPALLYNDQDLVIQAVRDYLDSAVDEVVVDDDAAYEKVNTAMRAFMPRSKVKLTRYQERIPLFSRFQLEDQIDSIFQRRVALASGGSIVIDGTEALTAIDVNSGKARSSNHEEAIFGVNRQAAHEVARQLRLRDIGGLIVVDFIDMRSRRHRQDVEREMRDAMKADKARSTVGRLSPNGLLEINRQRIKQSLFQRTHRPCPTCSGAGRIPSADTVSLNLLRRIEARAASGGIRAVKVRLHPELADALQNDRRQELAGFEREFGIRIEIVAATSLHRSQEEVSWEEGRPESAVSVAAAEARIGVTDLMMDGGPSQGRGGVGQSVTEDGEEQTDSPSRRRRRGRKKRKLQDTKVSDAPGSSEAGAPEMGVAEPVVQGSGGEEEARAADGRRKRRRRKGGRKAAEPVGGEERAEDVVAVVEGAAIAGDAPEEKGSSPKPRSRRRRKGGKKPGTPAGPAPGAETSPAPSEAGMPQESAAGAEVGGEPVPDGKPKSRKRRRRPSRGKSKGNGAGSGPDAVSE